MKAGSYIIFGYGGTGRELGDSIRLEHRLIGYLDDFKSGPEILGRCQDYQQHSGNYLSALASIKNMTSRRNFLTEIPIDIFGTFISRHALVSGSSKVGIDTTIMPFACVTTDVELGNHVQVSPHCTVSHDTVVGDFTVLCPAVKIAGGVKIGENCYVGIGTTIINGRTIGSNCLIAAGATVIDDVESGTIYYGPKRISRNNYF